jgi:drug/metabolite transporter (DMT)-like permease
VTMNAVGMTTGAALLVAGSLLADEPLALPRHPATWAALGYLVVVGSVLVFVLYLVVLRSWSASRAAYVFVLIPFVTVALSTWLDHEPVGARLAFGGLLVLAGVYIGALRPARTPPTPPAVPVPANAAGAMRANGAQANVAGRAVSEPLDAEGGRRWTTRTAGS